MLIATLATITTHSMVGAWNERTYYTAGGYFFAILIFSAAFNTGRRMKTRVGSTELHTAAVSMHLTVKNPHTDVTLELKEGDKVLWNDEKGNKMEGILPYNMSLQPGEESTWVFTVEMPDTMPDGHIH
jgi:hypothetical protein